jgi:putative nucleotidyltransferase with HDIG domain
VKRYLPHAVGATALVLGVPAALVWALTPAGSVAWALVAVPLAMLLSVAVAAAGSAVWARRPDSRELIFADLMLWGWVRRVRAERRLAEARKLLGATAERADGLAHDERVHALSRLSALLEARDAYTHGHTRRVTRHAERIARAMRLAPAEVAKVRTAAALHDVGKIHTPRAILNKPRRLTDDEFAVIRRHPVDGADMLAGIGDPEITAMVRHHHERLDGGGYPDGLAGNEIPLGARIIAVADTFDAMTSSRSYRGACRHKRALQVLAGEAGTQLDPDAVHAFLGYYSGQRSVAWSALVTTAPQRLLGVLGTSSQGLGAGAASVSQLLPAMGTAAVLAAAPAGAPGAERVPAAAERPPAARAHVQRFASEQDRAAVRERPAAEQRRGERRHGPAAPSRTRRSRGGAPTPSTAPRADREAPERSSDASAGSDAGGQSPEQRPVKPPESPTAPIPTVVPEPVSVPKVETPAVEVPAVEVPAVNVPGVELPAVETPRVELPKVELPPVSVPDVKLPGLKP